MDKLVYFSFDGFRLRFGFGKWINICNGYMFFKMIMSNNKITSSQPTTIQVQEQ